MLSKQLNFAKQVNSGGGGWLPETKCSIDFQLSGSNVQWFAESNRKKNHFRKKILNENTSHIFLFASFTNCFTDYVTRASVIADAINLYHISSFVAVVEVATQNCLNKQQLKKNNAIYLVFLASRWSWVLHSLKFPWI